MTTKMPKAEAKILEGLSHMPNMEAPDVFNAILLDFLETRINFTPETR